MTGFRTISSDRLVDGVKIDNLPIDTNAELNNKVDKETGKGLSTNDYTTTEKNKLAGIQAGAEVNNISDTNATDLTDGGDTTLHIHDSRYYTETEVDALLSAKQGTLTLTTTGSSGAATLIGDTLNIPEYAGGGIWGDITGTLSSQTDLQSALDGKEPTITAGTTSQYWRGDKSWQTLDKTAVGLGNVDNTSDATKNSATAILTNKTVNLTNNTLTGTKTQFNTAVSDGDIVFVGDTISGTNISGNISGNAGNVTGTVAIANGGTGQTTAQNAINALTQVASATNEYVLTKDTATGNATWKVASGGSFSWGATVTGTSGTGVGLTIGNSASSGTIGQSITIGNTQTNAGFIGLKIDTGTSQNYTRAIEIKSLNSNSADTQGGAISINNYSSSTQILNSMHSLKIGINLNTNSSYSHIGGYIINENNVGTGYNTGLRIDNKSSNTSSLSGNAISINQSGVGGTGLYITDTGNILSTNGLSNITLSNTQSGASILSKLDTGTSARAHIGQLINLYNASTTASAISVNGSTTGTGKVLNISGGALSYGIYQSELINTSNNSYSPIYFSTAISGNLTGGRTSNYANFNHQRINTLTSGTITDNYDLFNIRRRSDQNGVGGTFVCNGSVLTVENDSTQTAGTLTDNVNVIKIVQDDLSTGAGVYLSTFGTGKDAFKFDTGFTSDTAPTGASKYINIDIGGTKYRILAQVV